MLIGITIICKMQTIKKIQTRNNYLVFLLIVFSLKMFGKCATLQTTFTVSQTVICGPQSTTISFANSSTGNEAASAAYGWYLNGIAFDQTTGLSAPRNTTISDIGTYVFMLIGTDKNGCRDTALVNVFIRPVPVANFTINGTVCSGTTINFKNIASGTGNFTGYLWDFGDGKKSTEQNPIHTYTSVNSYVVSLTINNGTGCSSTYKDTIALSVAPVAAIKGKDKDGDTRYCLSENDSSTTDTVTFENISENAQSFRWDFGDGSPLFTTNSQVPFNHVYTSYGTFKVTMIATSSQNCEKSISLLIIFNKPVKSSFTIQPAELWGCMPHAVMPPNTSLNADEYVWNFGDGTPSVTTVNAAPFVHIYKKTGVFAITLKASNSCSSSAFNGDSIHVDGLPVAKFGLSPLSGCAPQTVIFTNQTNLVTGTAFHWNFGEGSVWDGPGNPHEKIYKEGKWKIQLTATNHCGSDSSSQMLNIYQAPPTPLVEDKIICKGAFAQLSVKETHGTYEWFDAPVNGTLLTTGPQFTTPVLNETATYFIQCKSANCVSERIAVKVIVRPLPDSPVVSGANICKGSIATLKIQAPGKYEWYNLPKGGICLDSTNSFTTPPLVASTEYYVQVTSGECKSLRTNVQIIVVDPPKANYKSDTVCLGESTAFQDLSSGNPNKWLWEFGDGHTSTEGPAATHMYATAGLFISKLVVTNAIGCHDSLLRVTLVNAPVSAQISVKDSACIFENLLLSDHSLLTADSIIESVWNFGDGGSPVSALHTSHMYNTSGNYTIEHTIVSGKGCKSKTSGIIYIAPLPVADFTSINTCEIQKSIFNDQSTKDVTQWYWSFGDGAANTEQHPMHAYTKSGYYQVLLAVKTNLGCMDTVSHQIFVYRQPKAAFTSDTVCWGDTTTFINASLSVDGNIDHVFWNFDDGTTSAEFAPRHVLLAEKDSFQVSLTITTSHGCRDTLTQLVRTHPIPVFHIFTTERTGCAAFTTAFIDSSTVAGGKIMNWLWDFGDGNQTHRRYPIHTFTEAGNYYVSLNVTSSYGCHLQHMLPYPIVVLPTPNAVFEVTPDEVGIDQGTVQFINGSTNSAMWDWNFGDHTTSIHKNNFHTYTDTGIFVVTLIAINEYGCNDTTYGHVRVNAQPQIYIPNAFSPDDDGLNDYFLPEGNGIDVFQMSIFDRWGKEIFSTQEPDKGWNGRIKGSGEIVLEGMYVYKIYIKDVLRISHQYTGNVFVIRR